MEFTLHDSGRIEVRRYVTHDPMTDTQRRSDAIDALLDAIDTAAIARALNRRGLAIYDDSEEHQ